MTDNVRQLIVERLAKMRLSMSNASVRIGRNTSYLQQFLRRGVPEELGERDRIKLAEVLGVNEGELRGNAAPLESRPYAKSERITMSSAGTKIDAITRTFQALARELRLTGQLKMADLAKDVAENLPESSKLRLHEILNEKPAKKERK
jgi:hypothetical protein